MGGDDIGVEGVSGRGRVSRGEWERKSRGRSHAELFCRPFLFCLVGTKNLKGCGCRSKFQLNVVPLF